VSSSQINLSWTASTDNVGVAEYLIVRCEGVGCVNFTQFASSSAANFINNAGLNPSTSYSYRVRAQDAAGNLSGYSNIASATTLDSVISNVSFIPLIEGVTNVIGRNFTIFIFEQGAINPLAQFIAQPDPNGKLILPTTVLIQSGIYDIFTATPGYLKKKMPAVSLVSNAVINLPLLPAGDLNSDNVINSLDWSLMSPKWFSQDVAADINGDNIVNTIDFSLLNKNWSLTGD
ncbi:MAG: dockerin type I domain-containing protein, partial [Patescibacteria group bacterium]